MARELLTWLLSSLEDNRVSRGERQAVRAQAAAKHLDRNDLAFIRAALFDASRRKLSRDADRKVLDGLEQALKVLQIDTNSRRPPPATRTWFGPEDPMVETLTLLLRQTRSSLDIAVFTITDDRITAEIIAAHERGVRVRVLSDAQKSADPGSDIRRLQRAGVAVVLDHGDHHFHHKFAVVDETKVVNGSYNWTRSADSSNRENFSVSYEPTLVRQFMTAFEQMWRQLGAS